MSQVKKLMVIFILNQLLSNCKAHLNKAENNSSIKSAAIAPRLFLLSGRDSWFNYLQIAPFSTSTSKSPFGFFYGGTIPGSGALYAHVSQDNTNYFVNLRAPFVFLDVKSASTCQPLNYCAQVSLSPTVCNSIMKRAINWSSCLPEAGIARPFQWEFNHPYDALLHYPPEPPSFMLVLRPEKWVDVMWGYGYEPDDLPVGYLDDSGRIQSIRSADLKRNTTLSYSYWTCMMIEFNLSEGSPFFTKLQCNSNSIPQTNLHLWYEFRQDIASYYYLDRQNRKIFVDLQ